MKKQYMQTANAIEDYVQSTFHPEDEVLREIRERSEKSGLPSIQLSPIDALHLEVIARSAAARKAVEIGTLAGYSGVAIARALPPNGKLFTFEYNPYHAQVARESFEKAGVLEKVEIFVGAALERLAEIEPQAPFDLVFIDADKVSYPAYLEWAERHLRVGGIFLADNTFAFGLIADEKNAEEGERAPEVKALRAFNKLAADHPNLRTTILPTGEGLTFGVKVRK